MNHRLSLLLAAAVATTACNRPGNDPDAFRWTSDLPAGSIVHIRNGAGDITVRRAPDGQAARVSGSRRWARGRAKDVRFIVNQSGNEYYVCAMWQGSGNCGSSGYRGRRTGGFLQMFSLFHRTTDASASFVAELPANVVVDARTTIGSVEVDGVAAGVTARSTSGTISASNVSGPLNLVTTNGDVRLSVDSVVGSGSIEVTTTNGSITAELPRNTEGNFDLSTVHGTVRSDFAVAPSDNGRSGRRMVGQLGQTSRVVKMRSVNGTVVVSARGAPTAQ